MGLAATNPGPVEFQEFAADQLTRLITEEICHEDGLPHKSVASLRLGGHRHLPH